MQTEEIRDKALWNRFFLSQRESQFLQSFEWGEFQHSVGYAPLRLRLGEEGNKPLFIQGFIHPLPLGFSFAYFPRIPNLPESALSSLQEYFKKYHCVFARIEPLEGNIGMGALEVAARQPQTTLLLDLSKSEEELLACFHSKTRYNIGLAERKGVVVREEKDAALFARLNSETEARDEFIGHAKGYYKAMIPYGFVRQLTAFLDGAPIASNLCIALGNTFVYLHGASSNEHRSVMAPYLLQWEAMRLAKREGYLWYDMWGVAPHDTSAAATSFHGYTWEAAHRWTGITRFKAGFGGEVREYPHGFELPLRPFLYRILQGIKRLPGRLTEK